MHKAQEGRLLIKSLQIFYEIETKGILRVSIAIRHGN